MIEHSRLRVVIILFLFCVVALDFGAFIFFDRFKAKSFSDFSKISDTNFDAAIVFYAGFKNSEPDRVSIDRYYVGRDLIKKKIANNVIFVGGSRPSKKLFGSELLARKMLEDGLYSAKVFFEKKSKDTMSSIIEAKKIMNKQKFNNVIFVSSIHHVLRMDYLITPDEKFNIRLFGFINEDVRVGFSPNRFVRFNYNLISLLAYKLLPIQVYNAMIHTLRK